MHGLIAESGCDCNRHTKKQSANDRHFLNNNFEQRVSNHHIKIPVFVPAQEMPSSSHLTQMKMTTFSVTY